MLRKKRLASKCVKIEKILNGEKLIDGLGMLEAVKLRLIEAHLKGENKNVTKR